MLSRVVAPIAPLPRLEPRRVFSPDTRTLVVTPLLVTSAEEADAQLRMLEINYLGNVEPELFFALLTDFRDAPERELPGERELLGRLERGIRALNERHGYREQPRFFVLHRSGGGTPSRAGGWAGSASGANWTSSTGWCWAPGIRATWVRARGRALGALRHHAGCRHAPVPGDAARLVATLHHPLNQARFDATGRRLVSGYALLQPCPEMEPTRSHWLATGGWPLSIIREKKSAQREAPWVLQQRLFGMGDFLGKGIYDVAAFARCLEGRLPENAILGHDKIEGMFARVAFVHDIRLFESHPTDFAVSARVWHRWVRATGSCCRGSFRACPPRRAAAFRIPCPSSIAGGCSPPSSTACATSSRSSCSRADGCGCRAGERGPGRSVWRCGATATRSSGAWDTCCGPRGAPGPSSPACAAWCSGFRGASWTPWPTWDVFLFNGVALDAMFRVLYRLAFDRSRMLDWTTFAQSSREARGLRTLLRSPR